MAAEEDVMIRVRAPVALVHEAQRVAALKDETLSQVVRRALRAYVASQPRQTDLEDAIAASKRSTRRSS